MNRSLETSNKKKTNKRKTKQKHNSSKLSSRAALCPPLLPSPSYNPGSEAYSGSPVSPRTVGPWGSGLAWNSTRAL